MVKLCNHNCHVICDHCGHRDAEELEKYSGEAWCRMHKKMIDISSGGCDDYACMNVFTEEDRKLEPLGAAYPLRKSWDEFYLEVAKLHANQSTCLRRHVGAVIVRDKTILSTGYNGAPAGLPHCEETGCLRQQLNIPSGERHEICRAAHAEQNAINNAAKNGVNINGATLYATTYPCSMCAKSIVNSGIKKIVYTEGYPDELTESILRDIEVVKIEPRQ